MSSFIQAILSFEEDVFEDVDGHLLSVIDAATKYLIPDLKTVPISKIMNRINKNNVFKILKTSCHNDVHDLKEFSLDFIVKNREDIAFPSEIVNYLLDQLAEYELFRKLLANYYS